MSRFEWDGQNARNAEKKILVLQGGGALGAYQAGAFAALNEADLCPEWVAGISIGAINSALIAGNPPERRVERLKTFWERVSSGLLLAPIATDNQSRKLYNELSAAFVAVTGVPGFFDPRIPPPYLRPKGSLEAISYYDTSPLEATLTELVDFDYLNSGKMRVSVGAVQVETGNLKFFDTAHLELRPQHIMASGALPPGFPPVIIDGEAYWDGGIVSNTPLQYVLDRTGPRSDMCVFQLDLFSAKGPMPETVFDITQREKDIRYSSRTRLNTDVFRELHTIRRAIRRLEAKMPEELKSSMDWHLLSALGCDAAITIVHLIHRRAVYATQSNDYEFSRFTINEHWRSGRDDVERTLSHPSWIHRERPKSGVTVLDLTKELDPPRSERHA